MKKDYVQLDGLRAIAAIAVVCFHYCPRSVGWWNALLASGPAAVGFFFLLSGFVLALRHPAVINPKMFWRARFTRIYPMYFLAFLLFAPIALQKYHHDTKTFAVSFVVNISMLQAWTSLAQSWNGPSWSLSVEAFLYAVFPFLVARIAKRPKDVRWLLLAMVPPTLAIGLGNHWIPATFWKMWVGNSPLFGVPAFAFGIALGLSRFRWRLTERRTDLLIAACMVGIVSAAIFWPADYREVFVTGGVILPLGALVVLCTHQSRVMQFALGNTMLVRLGKASYITYIMQSPLWHYFQVAANLVGGRPLTENNNGAVQFVIFLAILLGGSLLLERFVDEPIRAVLARKRESAPIGTIGVAA